MKNKQREEWWIMICLSSCLLEYPGLLKFLSVHQLVVWQIHDRYGLWPHQLKQSEELSILHLRFVCYTDLW